MTDGTTRRLLPGTRPAALVIALTASGLTACGSGTTTGAPATTERTSTVAPSPSVAPEPTAPSQGTAVLLTVGDTTVPGQLWDNAAARDLAARLPVTLTFSDYDAVEKTARLEPPLTMDGMPAGDDPSAGEIGWYAPGSVLVLYYGDVGYWNGIARLGTVDDEGIRLLADGPHDVTVTIAPADG